MLQAFNVDSEKTLIGRMPAKKGYPYKDLYWEFKEQFNRGKYQFIRNSHSYFGKQKQIEIFGVKEYAYLYIDRNNALQYFNKYLLNHGEEYAKLKDKDKDWKMVCGGYFVIISNLDLTPEEMLSRYFARVDIEGFFKTSKHYLDLLPIAKWKDETIRGGILFDMIKTIVFLKLRSQVNEFGTSVSDVLGKLSSLMCFRKDDTVTVETPNKQVKKIYSGIFKENVPYHVNLRDEKKLLGW